MMNNNFTQKIHPNNDLEMNDLSGESEDKRTFLNSRRKESREVKLPPIDNKFVKDVMTPPTNTNR